MTKAELLDAMRSGRARWEDLLAEVEAGRMDEPGVVGAWSVRDVVAHVSAYERFIAAAILADLRGGSATPRELYDRDDEPPRDDEPDPDHARYNGWVVEHARTRPLAEVLTSAREAYDRLREAVQALSDQELADPQRFAWLPGRALVAILPNQSFAHYAMHEPSVRDWLDAMEG